MRAFSGILSQAERLVGLFLRVCPEDVKDELVWLVKMRISQKTLKKKGVQGMKDSSSTVNTSVQMSNEISRRANQTLKRMGLKRFDVLVGEWDGEDDDQWHQEEIRNNRPLLTKKGLEVDVQKVEIERGNSLTLALHRSMDPQRTKMMKPSEIIGLLNQKDPSESTEMSRYKKIMQMAEKPPPGLTSTEIIQREIARAKGFEDTVTSMGPGDWIGKSVNINGRQITARKGAMLLKRKGEGYQIIRRRRKSKKEWAAEEIKKKEEEERAVPRMVRYFESLDKCAFGEDGRM